jgi:hypothetical protein
MALYFFDVRTPVLIEDKEGADLPDLASAIDEAAASATELVRSAERAQQDRDHWIIAVRDAAGAALFELRSSTGRR